MPTNCLSVFDHFVGLALKGLKCKLVESIEYTDARFMQQSIRPVEGSIQVNLYCWRYYLNTHSFICNTGNKIVICQLQNAKSNFPKFCKVYARQNQKTNLIHLHIHLVETIALILHSKVVFKKFFWLVILKISVWAYNLMVNNIVRSKYIFVENNKIETLFSNYILGLTFQSPPHAPPQVRHWNIF